MTSAETFGLAQLEAMAAGRPIINTALDTAVPLVARHGIEALTVPPGDPEQLADAIDTLIGDAERRRRMGEAAKLRATARYSTLAFREGIEMIYRQAVAASHAQAMMRRCIGSVCQITAQLTDILEQRAIPLGDVFPELHG